MEMVWIDPTRDDLTEGAATVVSDLDTGYTVRQGSDEGFLTDSEVYSLAY